MKGNDYHLARIKIPLNYPFNSGNDECTDGFSSAHVGGAFFAMGDGRVRFVSENIDFNIAGAGENNNQGINWPGAISSPADLGLYQRLGMRRDGQPIGEF